MAKKFEACLYNPAGTVRELNPISNGDLQNLSIPLLNVTTSKAITKGNIEIQAEELMIAYSKDDFFRTDTLYRCLIPMADNMHAETTVVVSTRFTLKFKVSSVKDTFLAKIVKLCINFLF